MFDISEKCYDLEYFNPLLENYKNNIRRLFLTIYPFRQRYVFGK